MAFASDGITLGLLQECGGGSVEVVCSGCESELWLMNVVWVLLIMWSW